MLRSERYTPFDEVRRFCLRRLPVSDVNDAVSEVYLVAWQKADEIPRGDEALRWLYGVARNVVRHTERSNRRRLRLTAKAMREPTSTVLGPEMQVVRHSDDEALATAIGRLSESDQEVIRLRGWEDLNAPAIAQVLGCSVSAAEKRVARAFKRVEKTLRIRNRVTTGQGTVTKRGDA
jgi:RNA polymerase sigma-70 factor (ECF subfamily)